jgi:hypothetical protein
MGEVNVDLGASWINGTGPECGDLEDWKDKENPIYIICTGGGIETLKTWDNNGDAICKYYSSKGLLDENTVADMQIKIIEHVSGKQMADIENHQ